MAKNIGMVLSGGGARGVAHLGVLQALHEMNIHPQIMSGTSAGAIAAAFYAGGYTMKETIEIVKKGNFFNFSSFKFSTQGLFSMKGFESIYNNYFPSNNFEDLMIPIHVTATNILDGSEIKFSKGKLAISLMASSCIPLVFQPIAFENMLLVDGGLKNNFPIEPLLETCDFIIGSHVNSLKKEITQIQARDLIDRSFHLALSHTVQEKKTKCDLFIEPPNMSQFSIFDVTKLDEIVQQGYLHTWKMRNEIESKLAS